MLATRTRLSSASQRCVAESGEVADPAVVDGVGIRIRAVRDRVDEPRAGSAVERGEVGRAEVLLDPGAENDLHPLGEHALDPLELVRVERELEDVRRLGARARELRVPRLVRERAEARGLVETDEEVGDPAPAVRGEDALVDDLRSCPKRFLGEARGFLEVDVVALDDLDDLAAVGAETREERRLVLPTLPHDELALLVLAVRPLERLVLDEDVELGQVRAREVVREIGGREPERAVGCETHVVGVSAPGGSVLTRIAEVEGQAGHNPSAATARSNWSSRT